MSDYHFTVSGREYTSGTPLIIAEIGTAHGGSIAKGEELIGAAAESGAGCVKFQHVYANEIIHPETGFVPLPGGPVALYERFRSLETNPEFLARMQEAARRHGLLFLCTPFGTRSARELIELGVEAMKVASPELNHLPLLRVVASCDLPTILSTGVSLLGDIELAVETFRQTSPDVYGRAADGRLALLHCVTAYPAPPRDYNLRILPLLSALLGIATGISDHSLDPVLIPTLAIATGACIVEKHICLSRDDDGLDDPIALPPAGFSRMCTAIRAASEAGSAATIEAITAEYGAETVEAVLGDGCKRLAPSEAANYMRTNRSLHASRAIREGETLTEENVAVLRTEKILRPGLVPALLPVVLGRKAARDISDGQGLEWVDVGG
ncbi:MAG: spore coat protein [Spirochaetales bacterium]|nr:MAG: spore coat protein [Spirochaetales bacterium]